MSDYVSAYWTVFLPADWVATDHPECATFERHAGVGAPQVSAVHKEGFITEEDLREFADNHLEAGAKTKSVKWGGFEGFLFSYRDDENTWCQWFLRCAATAVFVTYNCPLESKGENDEIVDSILGSLKSRQLPL